MVNVVLTVNTQLGNLDLQREIGFGQVALSESKSIVIPVTVTGPMLFTLVEVDDPEGLFTLQNNCPLTIFEATICDFTITFTPNELGVSLATLLVESADLDEPLIMVQLGGVGVEFVDSDGDGISDLSDNCTLVSNADQTDTDSDNYGNACDPDFNNDLIVNFLDVAEFGNMFNTTTPLGDLNNDGAVNFLDFSIVSSFFMQPPGPSGTALP